LVPAFNTASTEALVPGPLRRFKSVVVTSEVPCVNALAVEDPMTSSSSSDEAALQPKAETARQIRRVDVMIRMVIFLGRNS
jgi:hypothetical protein